MNAAEVFRGFHEAWSAGDVERVLELSDPEVVARPVHQPLFSRREYRGHLGLRRWFEEMTAPWESFETLVEDVHATPEGVVGFLRLVGRRGDRTWDGRVASVCEVRDGRIVSITARDVWDVEEELAEGLA